MSLSFPDCLLIIMQLNPRGDNHVIVITIVIALLLSLFFYNNDNKTTN